jgi:integrase
MKGFSYDVSTDLERIQYIDKLEKLAQHIVKPKILGDCMNGSIFFQKDRNKYAIDFYVPEKGRSYIITRYQGQLMYDKRIARKCLSIIQGKYELYQLGKSTFHIEEFLGKGGTDVIKFFQEWMKDVIEPSRKPATIKGYNSYFKNWIKPFFEENKIMLHQIQLDTLIKLKNYLKLKPKGKYNVMNCVHGFLDYAKRTNRISALPSFPKKAEYGLQEPEVIFYTQEEQNKIFNVIPEAVKPIFLFMKYHYRRNAEAYALQWRDFDEINTAFTIQRTFSGRVLVESTKTNAIHHIPVDDDFISVLMELKKVHDANKGKGTDFIFQNPRSRRDAKHFDDSVIGKILKKACKESKVRYIGCYPATKHTQCMHYINDVGGSQDELQVLTDHKRRDSLKHYCYVGLDRKRELMMKSRKVVNLDTYRTPTN